MSAVDYKPGRVAPAWHTIRIRLDSYFQPDLPLGAPYVIHKRMADAVRKVLKPHGILRRQVFVRHGCVCVQGHHLYINVIDSEKLTAADRRLIKKAAKLAQEAVAQVKLSEAEIAELWKESMLFELPTQPLRPL